LFKTSPKIFVNASNCHSGGGKTLLNAFLKGLSGDIEVIVYVDSRFELSQNLNKSVRLIKVNRLKRVMVAFTIKKCAKRTDKIFYFGNLPPLVRFKSKNVILLLSSRFYVDSISMKGFHITTAVKIFLEKIYYKIFIKNISHIIVQTSSMYEQLIENGTRQKISIWAFDDMGNSAQNIKDAYKKEPSTFMYVASLLPYKNHKRLLMAWNLLKSKNINAKLYLTIDDDTRLRKWIENIITKNNLNVTILYNLKRTELMGIYSKVETLIYPSLFEAYGLPLIEAKKYKMKVLAADLDYCWNFIEPDDYFNPYDVKSIARAVKRSLNMKDQLDKIYTPNEFFKKLIDL
jgi:glycosyltransferase involved in cell wall biosynthesis